MKVYFEQDPWYLVFPEDASGHVPKRRAVLDIDAELFNEFKQWEAQGSIIQAKLLRYAKDNDAVAMQFRRNEAT